MTRRHPLLHARQLETAAVSSACLGIAVAALLGMMALTSTEAAPRGMLTGLGLLALLGLAGVGYGMSRSPLRDAAEAARRIAGGDVSHPVLQAGAGHPLLQALEDMREQTFHLVADVRARTLAIATSSGHIGADQAAVAAMVRTQADALESTASSFEQLSAAIAQSADNAVRAHQLATSALSLASQGGEVVAQVVRSMGEIRSCSDKIVDIIAVIDSIAFQTKILALNAAVEAASAGQQGHGFAVVASEVRNLANRSADAAKSIKVLIDDSQRAVSHGSVYVDRAGASMKSIVASVERVAQIMTDMSVAAREQSSGVGEINRAVIEIDAATRQHAIVVERAAEPVRALHQQAMGLTEAVAAFKLGEREFASVADAVALVKRGVQYIKARGPQALVAEVNRLDKGEFIDRDLYLSVYSMDVRCLAHGVNSRLVGVQGNNFKDMDGKPFVQEIMAVACGPGSGTVTYKWLNPLTQKAMLKSTYVERCGELILSCGAYVDRG